MSEHSRSRLEIRIIAAQTYRFARVGGFGKLWRVKRAIWNGLWSPLRRRRARRHGLLVPVAIAISPTMRCNLACTGCYALDYPRDGEIPLEKIGEIFKSAAGMGVYTVVVTGGEPLLREGLLDLLIRHRRLTFLMITNGLLVDDAVAMKIARSGNVVPTVSVEGYREETDTRRGSGVHEKALCAMALLERYGAVFGFSTTVTRHNWQTVSSESFTDQMIAAGCVLGFHTEYVPIASNRDMSVLLTDSERGEFRRRILALRRSKPIIIAHLPDDEYDSAGRCEGVAGGTVHINSQGYVEPCPFCHYASDNILEKTLEEVIQSPFLAELRASRAIYRDSCVGCALVENDSMVREISGRTGARRTDG